MIRNHLSAILLNHICHATRDPAMKLPSGQYWCIKQLRKQEEEKEQF